MEDYVIISLPYSKQVEQNASSQFSRIQSQLGPALRHFKVPNLKVGTLDSLMEASDELAKLDPQVEGACFKLAGLLEEATGNSRASITVHASAHQEVGCETYWKQFQWNNTHYNEKDSIKSLLERLGKETSDAEERVRSKLSEFTETRQKLAGASRRGTGNLALRPIGDDVAKYCKSKGYDRPIDSDFLTTVFVAVPQALDKEWTASYWQINDFVCPKSSTVVARDADFILYAVIVFKKTVDDFKMGCRKRKYIVREAHQADDMSQDEFKKLQHKADEDKSALTKLLIQQFNVCFTAWAHVKAIRIFVESLLRYGLPPKFVAAIMIVDEKREQEIRARIKQLYPELSTPLGEEGAAEIGALQYEFPYVSLKVGNILRSSH